MTIIEIMLVLIVALLAGFEGILDEFQFHQPLVACTLIGLFTNHLHEGIILGGALQMIALGWANVGAAVAPDAALASVISSIFMVHALTSPSVSVTDAIGISIVIAIPLSAFGTLLTAKVRRYSVGIVHKMDKAAESANFKKIEQLQYQALFMQGLRVALPALVLVLLPSSLIANLYLAIPAYITHGLIIAVGLISAVGFAVVINVLSNGATWPYFVLGFILASINQLTLVALATIGIIVALVSVNKKTSSAPLSSKVEDNGDELDQILNDYE